MNTILEDSNPYWISFSDIMAGTLVIFILVVVLLIIQIRSADERKDRILLDVRETIVTDIVRDLHAEGITVGISTDTTSVLIPTDQITFESAKWDIPEEKALLVINIGRTVYNNLKKDDRYQKIETVFIEGHTDSDPVPDHILEKLGNWGLSAARAISIWRLWTESAAEHNELAELLKLKNVRGESLFSVSGYADTRRIEIEESTKEQKAANRRISIRFTMLSRLDEKAAQDLSQ